MEVNFSFENSNTFLYLIFNLDEIINDSDIQFSPYARRQTARKSTAFRRHITTFRD